MKIQSDTAFIAQRLTHTAILSLPISQHANNNTFVPTGTALRGNVSA